MGSDVTFRDVTWWWCHLITQVTQFKTGDRVASIFAALSGPVISSRREVLKRGLIFPSLPLSRSSGRHLIFFSH